MKIGILTQPLCSNYGGILQNYALQTYLRKLGHIPVTFNVPVPAVPYHTKIHRVLSTTKRTILKLGCDPGIVFLDPVKNRQMEVDLAVQQKEFIGKYIYYINVSVPITSNLYSDYPQDAYIVGSDQVWRPCYTQFIGNYFFDFLSDVKDVKKISYAASFGVDKWEMDEKTTEIARQLIKQFDAISVRELSGVELCKKYLNTDARCMLDPTLLLVADEYRTLYHGRLDKEKYICVYTLDYTTQKLEIFNQISKRMGLPIKFIGRFTRKGYTSSIEEWLKGIGNAQLVLTDSFHGTVFSILFNKPFLTISNEARGSARFDSLFKMLDIKGRTLSLQNPDYKNLDVILSYKDVNNRLAELGEEAKEFVANGLK